MAMQAADTGQLPKTATNEIESIALSTFDAKRKSNFFQYSSPAKDSAVPEEPQTVNGSKVVNNMIVFSHNG